MDKKDFQILIVDDDPTVGKALQELLTRSGYSAHWESNPAQVEKSFKFKNYHLAIIDAMLPKISGLDLAKQLYQESNQELKILFISGVFKDKQFISKAKNSVNAIDFLTKPVNSSELLKIIDSQIYEQMGVLNSFQALYLDQRYTLGELISALNSDIDLCGFEIPFLFNLLSHYQFTGEFQLEYSNKKSYLLSFHNGQIANIQSKDLDSYFGVLLVEFGYSEVENVKNCLKSKNKNKKIGQRLIDANALSPHAIDIIYKKQLQIRLSQSLQNDSVQVSIKEKEVEQNEIQLSKNELSLLTAEWVLTKISSDWIESFFQNWSHYQFAAGLNYKNLESILNISIVEDKSLFTSIELEQKDLNFYLEKYKESKNEFLFGLYYLMINSVFNFSSHSISYSDEKAIASKLSNLEKTQREQNHFQVLGVSTKANSVTIQKAYQELGKSLHPDKFVNYSQETMNLAEKIFSRVTEAYNILKEDKSRNQYLKSLESAKYETALQSEMLMDKAIQLLKNRKFPEALDLLKKVKKSDSHPSLFDLYYIWAHLKIGPVNSKFEEFHQKLHSWIQQVPQEDRHNALYFFIKGLFYTSTGYTKKSLENFQKAIALDPSFIEARREMVKAHGPKTKGKNSVDKTQLTKVFSQIFKFKN